MDKYDNNQILAVEETLKGIKGCYEAALKDCAPYSEISLVSETYRSVLTYAINTLDLHLQLAQAKFENWKRQN